MTITIKFYEYGVNENYPDLPYCVEEQKRTFDSFTEYYNFLAEHTTYHNELDTGENILTMIEMKPEEIDWD